MPTDPAPGRDPARSVGLALLAFYMALGAGLAAVPLLDRLHAESSAVVAAAAFFAAGLSTLVLARRGVSPARSLRLNLALLAVPWAWLTLALLWAPNCGYAYGLLFYLLFPVVSVVLAAGLAAAIARRVRRGRTALFVAAGLGIVVLGPLYDLGLHPQFYVYNHVFGGILGPIYDEELALRGGLFAFRGLSLLWAALLWLLATGSARTALARALGVALVLAVGLCYLFSARLGLNTPAWYLAKQLGGHARTEHFDLYFDPAALGPAEVVLLADDHEYRYARLSERLGVSVGGRIRSYLYPDPETKARLTGARYTNVAPVWLPEPQVHVLLPVYEEVFGHELVHVFSREFGLPLVHASLEVGLVEGLAVALEPPSAEPSVHEQVAAVLVDEPPGALADAVSDRLGPFGFWTGRGAVSYTTMGSFVRFLFEREGAEPLKAAYPTGAFEAAYGRSVEVLAEEWEAWLRELPYVARGARGTALRRFSVPSLFEQDCPHHVPAYRRAYAEAEEALARGDTTAAFASASSSLEREPGYIRALALWAALALAEGRSDTVAARLSADASTPVVPALAVRLGDARALQGRASEARAAYETALGTLPPFEHEARALVFLRTLLADDPRLLDLVVRRGDPAVRAAALLNEGAREPAAVLTAAVLLSTAEAYDAAANVLRSAPFPEEEPLAAGAGDVLRRQRLAWLAEWSYRAGRRAEAVRYAGGAAAAYRAAGDERAAEALEDLASKAGRTL